MEMLHFAAKKSFTPDNLSNLGQKGDCSIKVLLRHIQSYLSIQ